MPRRELVARRDDCGYRLGYYLAISIPQFAPTRARSRQLILLSRGVEPVFPDRDGALSSAESRVRERSGEIRILDSAGAVKEVVSFTAPRSL
jgi:hypothetical protein